MPAGFPGLCVRTGLKGESDHEKTDPSVRRGNGREQQGEKRETPGVREEVNAATDKGGNDRKDRKAEKRSQEWH